MNSNPKPRYEITNDEILFLYGICRLCGKPWAKHSEHGGDLCMEDDKPKQSFSIYLSGDLAEGMTEYD